MIKYDKYKPSGVEWIGEIPEHWEVKKLKYLGQIVLGKMLASEEKKDYELKPYLRAANLQWINVDINDMREMWFSEAEMKKYRLAKDDLLMSEGGEVGRACMWNDEIPECYIQNSVHKISFNQYNYSKFFMYQNVLLGWFGYFDSIVNRISIAHLTVEKLSEVSMITPPLDEQQNIVAYLDEKCGAIDAVIERKERLLELYAEKRQAIINRAVTRGIDPSAPMRDSGIPWLGSIPAHWEVKKLKWVTRSVQTGSTPKEEYQTDTGFFWYTPSDFCSNNIYLGESKRKISYNAIEDNAIKVFPKNSVLMIGIGATLGKIGVVSTNCTSNQQINAICFDAQINYIYGAFFLQSIITIIGSLSNAATLAIINQSQTKDIVLPVPMIEEQTAIVNYIEEKCGVIDTITEKLRKQIELYKEYRTALIANAVTGKIKVTK